MSGRDGERPVETLRLRARRELVAGAAAPSRPPFASVLDLRVGARVRLTAGPYEGDVGRVVEKNKWGDFRLRFERRANAVPTASRC